MRANRRVHGKSRRGEEIVRYNVTGKWYLERESGIRVRVPVEGGDRSGRRRVVRKGDGRAGV